MLFKEIIGQESLKKQLIQTVHSGRISHAQLFLGKSGYGVLPLAIAYAQYIQCSDKQADDSCGKCPSCLKLNKLIHPDIHFSFPVNTSKRVTSKPKSDDFIQNWRNINIANKGYFDLTDWHREIEIETKQSLINVLESQEIIKKLSLKAFEAEFKILILWLPENMNVQASNKLLKLIEEPTDKTIILLVAEEEEQLLKTITSRTQLIRVAPVNGESLTQYLMNNKQLSEEQAKRIVLFSEGNVLHAESKLIKSEEDDLFFNLFKDWMRACYEANIDKMYAWVEEISSRSVGREKQKRFLEYALEVIREGLIRNYTGENLLRFDGAEGQFIVKFAPFVHENNVFGVMDILTEAHQHVSRNAYAKILFMDMSMKFANLLRVKKRTFVS